MLSALYIQSKWTVGDSEWTWVFDELGSMTIQMGVSQKKNKLGFVIRACACNCNGIVVLLLFYLC